MRGFGASLTDSSAWLIDQRLNATQRSALVESLFSTAQGAGMNYLRLPMGASDFTASGFYTYNDLAPGQTDINQSQFSIAHDQAYIVPLLQQIKSVNPELQLMASPWSAPAWMKTNDSLFGGQLNSQYRNSYALYFRKFLQAYAAEGLPIDAITLQNEPLFEPNDYPSMGMTAADQAALVRAVGPALNNVGLETDIVLYDHNWDNIDFADQVLNDPIARQFVAGTAFHGYAGDVTAQSTLHDAHPDKGIYFTEVSGGDFAPNFAENLVWGVRNIIIGNTRNWGETALFWNLALDENSGPHLNGCNNCRGVVTIENATGNIELNEEFYTIAHASKFVRPGAKRIASSTTSSIESVAFQNPDGSKVLIALNPATDVQSFSVVENGESFAYALAGQSVGTFVWNTLTIDFDDDGNVDGTDVDQLVAAIVSGNNSPLFDVNNDSLVDQDDLTDWLIHAGDQNLGAAYLVGDANLDGTVDGADFIAWNTHKFSTTAAWTQGDFTADGTVDGLDFIQWNGNKFQNSDSALAVPEAFIGLGWYGWLLFLAVRNRRLSHNEDQ
jgi:glucosylceramidase